MTNLNLLDLLDAEEPPKTRQLKIPGARVITTVDHPLVARIQVLPEARPGEQRPKIHGEYLSASQINKYTRCQASYMFHYMYGVKEPVNSALIFGSAMHSGAEFYLDAKRQLAREGRAFEPLFHHLPFRQAAVDAATFYVRNEVRADMDWKTQWQNGPEETFESLLAGVQAAAIKMADEVWATMNPQAIEHGYVIEWHDTNVLPILGYTDAIDKIVETALDGTTTEEEVVIDMKSGKEKKEADAQCDVALSFYSMAREIETGKRVRKVGYESYVRNKAPKIARVQIQRDEDTLARAYVRARALSNLRRLMFDDPKNYVMTADDASKCVSCFYNKNGMCGREFGVRATKE